MRKNPLTTLLLAFSFLLGPLHADETTESNAQLLRDALFAEEAERDLAKAEQGYRELVKNFDTDRVYAATAILRLAEILHQRGDSDEAEKWFARVLREFPDQEALVKVATARLGDKAAGLARVGPVPIDPQAEEIARLTKLLEQSPDLLNTPIDGTTPLATAAAKGQLEVIEFLLRKGAQVNSDANMPSALNAAVKNGHLTVVAQLIEDGAKLEKDLVNIAVRSGNLALTELLLEAGAEVNVSHLLAIPRSLIIGLPNPKSELTKRIPVRMFGPGTVEWTPLEIAIFFRFRKLTDLLLANGATPQKERGNYPEGLRFAIIDKDVPLVAKLLEHRADPDSQWNGACALSIAAALGNIEITKLLIKAGANVNLVEEPEQTTPLHHADTATTAILIAAEANPNVKDQEGNSLLHLGLNAAKLEILIAAGADLNALNNEGKTPLIKAVENLRADLVTALIQAGAKPNGIPNTPAPLAFLPEKRGPKGFERGKFYGPVIRALVEAGSDPNAVDQSNVTALIRAASSDDLETVRYLLEKGAALEVAGKFAYEAAPHDSPIRIELFLKTYQQPERRRGTIRVVSAEKGLIHEEVAALAPTGNERPICPYSLLEAYFFSNPDFNFTLGEVTIWREGRGEVMKFDLRKIITSGDPKQDVKLAWGDLVQFSLGKFPEDSAVNETEKKFLDEHLNREVQFNYIGKTRTIRMSPKWRQGKDPGLWLRDRWNNIYALTDDVETIALRPTQALGLGDESGRRYIVSGLERNGLKIQLEPDKLATFWFEPSDQVSLSIAAEKKRSRYIPRPK